LNKDGVFIFDFWNGNAVLGEYSPLRIRREQDGNLGLIRITNTVLDKVAQIATLNFDFILTESGSIVREFTELHKIRYFFPQEMSDLLNANGFEVIHTCPFLKDEEFLNPNDWNITYVVRCV
jgi:hypothetical protein